MKDDDAPTEKGLRKRNLPEQSQVQEHEKCTMLQCSKESAWGDQSSGEFITHA